MWTIYTLHTYNEQCGWKLKYRKPYACNSIGCHGADSLALTGVHIAQLILIVCHILILLWKSYENVNCLPIVERRQFHLFTVQILRTNLYNDPCSVMHPMCSINRKLMHDCAEVQGWNICWSHVENSFATVQKSMVVMCPALVLHVIFFYRWILFYQTSVLFFTNNWNSPGHIYCG